MEFPKIWNRRVWEIVDADEKFFWLRLPNGVQKNIGPKIEHRKILKYGPAERILEVNFFNLGIFFRAWFLGEERDGKFFKKVKYSQLLKDGRWIWGMKNEGIVFGDLKNGNKFIGVFLKLKVAPGRTEQLFILKEGRIFNSSEEVYQYLH
ncbi:MAG: hypothetical protein A3I89_01510 [Candidatus Harrisonbacteria bacterium RIFCSPLOWO2_02_FULL_41_11]|uniref:Uncharacterized protein n=1 Tax=Candidatus Harrisonbacteria bacterium RIFCSPHIGHO2_02_FULL_42_16 TaxID=1798404 RepID=A0A1G1ZF80_9BACT|nr:MAG: hypothetical protein A3B92_03980 [Candidatus Harrisonbacteria bacterium RIFCSPHIGHO2_02_FULL_42_16]OGY66733.1 MAG: hypothetical protein A3I89_01510 [Candidatus Harrisonbacteria bacterium RIFCSPLOWO2_02_FULL_41_11]